ncbi:unnamed protein product [Notodromas monacha]|uniref:Uncharacterized protein n=1 Tax=Notodromas monacha TaxID=399045 RepID=A0A7R9BZG9_9CRUS|nr:unnamed protein product [Notodromas monacha]CAG0924530.1 unnamed protein product [Notodromas monacha]
MERCKPPTKGIRVRLPELPLHKSHLAQQKRNGLHNDATTPDDVPASNPRQRALPSSYEEFQQYLKLLAVYPLPPPWDYHWDCSDWAKGSVTPLPNITEVSAGEVPDSSSFHSNESNESNVPRLPKPVLPGPTSVTTGEEQDQEIETLPVLDDVDAEYVGEMTDFDLDSQGDIPFSDAGGLDVIEIPFADAENATISGAESVGGDEHRILHPDDYLPTHHLTMSENETTDSESAALWRRRPRIGPRRAVAGSANRRGFVSRDSFIGANNDNGRGGNRTTGTSGSNDENDDFRVCDIEDSSDDTPSAGECTRLIERSCSPPIQITKL